MDFPHRLLMAKYLIALDFNCDRKMVIAATRSVCSLYVVIVSTYKRNPRGILGTINSEISSVWSGSWNA